LKVYDYLCVAKGPTAATAPRGVQEPIPVCFGVLGHEPPEVDNEMTLSSHDPPSYSSRCCLAGRPFTGERASIPASSISRRRILDVNCGQSGDAIRPIRGFAQHGWWTRGWPQDGSPTYARWLNSIGRWWKRAHGLAGSERLEPLQHSRCPGCGASVFAIATCTSCWPTTDIARSWFSATADTALAPTAGGPANIGMSRRARLGFSNVRLAERGVSQGSVFRSRAL